MKTPIALLVVAGLCVLAGGAHAQALPDEQGVEMATGTVVWAAGSSLVITTDEGVGRTFATSETTLMPLTVLVSGDRVRVKFRSVGVGLEAVDVSVVEPVSLSSAAGDTMSPAVNPELRAPASATVLLAFLFTVILAVALAFHATRLLQ